MSMMFPDLVEITNVTCNVTYRNETEGTPFKSSAFVENEDRVERTINGTPIDPENYFFLPPTVDIAKGDYIKIIKLHGKTPNIHDSIRRKVTKAFYVGAFKNSHIECETGGSN